MLTLLVAVVFCCWLAVAVAGVPTPPPPCLLPGRCVRRQVFVSLFALARPATTAGAAAGSIAVAEMMLSLTAMVLSLCECDGVAKSDLA